METTEEQQCAQVTACAFTGHRPTRFTFKYDEAHPGCIELKAVLTKQIDFLYRQGVTDFYISRALGADMWAGEAVLSLMELHPEVKLHCITFLFLCKDVSLRIYCFVLNVIGEFVPDILNVIGAIFRNPIFSHVPLPI